MDFFTLIQQRYSVRAYKPDPVPEEDLEKILQAARLAPTAANRQPFQLIVVHTSGREQELRKIYDRAWFVQAPLILCACGLPGGAWTREDNKNYAVVDVAIVMDHLILAATALGLGTCWVAAFDASKARSFLGLPAAAEPIAFTPLGFPADQPRPKERKPLEALVRYEHW
jgi:nitroreductase